jgi:formylglycine-generating enzyme required for sulfatase activity
MPAPRIFLSHSSHDAAFTARLEADLRAAGATVYRVVADQGGDFVKAIDDALAACEWVVLVLTTDALASPWVQQEIRAAIRLKNQGRIRGILPIQAGPVDLGAIPPLWGVYNVFDATANYTAALAHLLAALSLSPAAPSPVAPASAPALPGAPALHLTPKTLYDLGFAGRDINGVEIVLPPTCPVPAGPFIMGSDKARDPQATDDETPQYMIETGAFSIGTFPVTVAEYACAVRVKAVPEPHEVKSGGDWATQPKRLEHPVVNVSWKDAVDYAAWLARTTGQLWRLPTEAEWEKVARGTDGRLYPWGDSFDMSRCNTNESKIGTTTPVGAYPGGASPYGAQDLAGNVWEWTSSLFRPYPYRQNDGRERLDSTEHCVVRGGSWYVDATYARAARRGVGWPDSLFDAGFRVAASRRPVQGT